MNKLGGKKQKGQASLEFVLILPLLLFLIFGMIELCLVYDRQLHLEYACFKAARYAIVSTEKVKKAEPSEDELFSETQAASWVSEAEKEAQRIMRDRFRLLPQTVGARILGDVKSYLLEQLPTSSPLKVSHRKPENTENLLTPDRLKFAEPITLDLQFEYDLQHFFAEMGTRRPKFGLAELYNLLPLKTHCTLLSESGEYVAN